MLFLLVIHCLNSLEFVSCCLALHKQVVIDNIKQLSIFATNALSTLVHMFFFRMFRATDSDTL